MAVYGIFDVDIRNMEQYGKYMQLVKPAIEAAGGKYLVRGGAHEVWEGDWQPTRLVLLEFPSMEAAEGFYNSPIYRELKAMREACSVTRALVAVEGV